MAIGDGREIDNTPAAQMTTLPRTLNPLTDLEIGDVASTGRVVRYNKMDQSSYMKLGGIMPAQSATPSSSDPPALPASVGLCA